MTEMKHEETGLGVLDMSLNQVLSQKLGELLHRVRERKRMGAEKRVELRLKPDEVKLVQQGKKQQQQGRQLLMMKGM